LEINIGDKVMAFIKVDNVSGFTHYINVDHIRYIEGNEYVTYIHLVEEVLNIEVPLQTIVDKLSIPHYLVV
jgi:hypothetical protein